MKPQDEQRELWRDALGDDATAIWSAFEETNAPPLAIAFEHRSEARIWRVATVAAASLAGLSLLWNWQISTELARTRTEYALALLDTSSSPARLQALDRLSNSRLTPVSVTAIRNVVTRSRDPNVQLAALEVLLGSDSLDAQRDAQPLLEQVSHNRAFVESALRMRRDEQGTPL